MSACDLQSQRLPETTIHQQKIRAPYHYAIRDFFSKLSLVMMNLHFVWLGSGRTRKFEVTDKPRLLDKAARAGLPVPNGGLLLDLFFRLAWEEDVVREENGAAVIPDPIALLDLLYKAVHFPHLDKPLAIRSCFPNNIPGQAHLNIQPDDAEALSRALSQIWTAVLPYEDVPRDVLIMEMVEVQVGGTAVTDSSADSDRYSVNGDRYSALPRPGWFGRSNADLPDYGRRLQKLLGGVRRTLGKGKWEVEWGDDGRICWILQIKSVIRDG